jgi:nitrite reductase/ring-hydroxylating ferredoxin subunit
VKACGLAERDSMQTFVYSSRLRSDWRKSSFSVGDGECVEVAQFGSLFLIRDSRNQNGLVLLVTERQFRALVQRLKV